MATLANTNPTLADLVKATDPDGSIASVVEVLSQSNEILDDMTWIEGNLPTGHRSTIRTGLPVPTWRKLYGGVQPAKSERVQITDNCGMLEAYAEIDKALADLNGNTAAFRLSEDRAHIEGMSQAMATALFYGNETTTPAAFTGLAPRYNSLSAENADNIVSHGGSGSDNASIWLVVWGPDSVHGITPKGSKAGLQSRDLGEVTVEDVDGSGGRMQAYRTHYRWDAGLTVRDWRYVVRIANIDVSDLGTLANTKNLITSMVMASERIPALGKGRACWYVNRTIREKLRLGITEKIVNNLSWETVAGKRVMTFDDIPVRRCDVLLNTEAAVS
ncbi:major capsid protein [Insolitispirillum peregrinum]|uniref:Phage protein n=1 Tax=Insolitispirillum peregrinum TaxID=80876 RepID=A0A1N7LG58_9PROT|nr:hypothetical protein [Insolitispirillum peregrinum]SIS72810.1 hypothetical protein SAMN05421779_103309 [Insolitispirillum peregrinum]